MKNERGVTLVEMLAAIAILTVILLLGFQLFSTVQNLWSNTNNQYHYKSQVNSITSTLNNELSSPTCLGGGGNVLQFTTSDGKSKAVKYEDGSLWLYSGATRINDIANDVSDFKITLASGDAFSTVNCIDNTKITLSITIPKRDSNETLEFPIETIK